MSDQKTTPKVSKIRGKYDILKDSWNTILADTDMVSKPVKPNEHIPTEKRPVIHREDTLNWHDGGSICSGSKNESRSILLQHKLGSIPVRLAIPNRDGANFHRSIQTMSNRDRRRMTAYNAKKVREANGTSLA